METYEIWKDIEDYEGWYQVSNTGKVRSVDRTITYPDGKKYAKHGKVLSPKEKNGYLYVVLSKNCTPRTLTVHRLVAKAFIPNPRNLPEVNHKNEVKSDNRIENLEWMSHVDNNNYGTKNERAAKRRTNGKLSKTVLQIDPNTMEILREWPSTAECGRNGFNSSLVSACCRRKIKTHHGYIWKYKKGED